MNSIRLDKVIERVDSDPLLTKKLFIMEEKLKQLYAKKWRIAKVIIDRNYHPYNYQRFMRMLDKAYVNELKRNGWTRVETHGYSKSGQRFFDGYEYRHNSGLSIKL